MQDVLGERLRAHKRKAEPVVRWLKEREEGRGLMRGVFAAWAGARGSHNVPNTHLSHEDWKAWRAKETATQRDERRLREAVDRAASYGKLCWANFPYPPHGGSRPYTLWTWGLGPQILNWSYATT